jgi:hypothetical protein
MANYLCGIDSEGLEANIKAVSPKIVKVGLNAYGQIMIGTNEDLIQEEIDSVLAVIDAARDRLILLVEEEGGEQPK